MTLLTTPFGFASTADEVAEGIPFSGKKVVVTGGAAGIGLETARSLARIGAEVTLAVRDLNAGLRAAQAITASTGNAKVSFRYLDLANRSSIDAFVTRWKGPLHVLINNAGVMGIPLQRSREGWEMQFAVNHLGHFLLAHRLYEAMAEAGAARIVSVSSSAHQRSPVIFEDLQYAFRPYDPIDAYGQSKTANVLFAVAASNRWGCDGITANAAMPGAIPTGLQRHIGGMKTPLPLRKSAQQGAATSVLLATAPMLAGIGGCYFSDCNEAAPLSGGEQNLTGVAPYALDPHSAERLWDESLRLLGL